MKYFRRKYLELLKPSVPLDLSRSCLHIFNHFCPLNWALALGRSCLCEVSNHSKASINQFTPYILSIFYWCFMQTSDACVLHSFKHHVFMWYFVYFEERMAYLYVFLSLSMRAKVTLIIKLKLKTQTQSQWSIDN